MSTSRPIPNRIAAMAPELTEWRRDIHTHPELGLEEVRTAAIVAQKLAEWGIEVHTGLAKTGVVGTLKVGNGTRSIGIRADMDALAMEEANGFAHRSQSPGKMHACGHDGHTAMLLGAARYLAETRRFSGTVNFIFQPGEEGAGGALAMLADGLFERFACDAIFGMHNRPGSPIGQFSITPGPAMSGGAFFDVDIVGKGAHGARPEEAVDPVLAASHIVTALQSIVARNVSPFDMAVVSVTRISGGEAYNVIPERARLGGTVRAMRREVLDRAEAALQRLASSTAAAFGAAAKVDFRVIFAPLVNHAEETREIADAAAEIAGEANVDRNKPPAPASEDFSFMLEKVPGAFINIGNGRSAPVHNDRYDFNDEAIPYGAALLARVAERRLARP